MGFGVPGERAYHFQFFTAGIFAMLIAWLLGNCKEAPGEMVEVIGRRGRPMGSGIIFPR